VTVYSADWVLPVEGEPIRDGAVRVEGGRIAAVGPVSELGRGERFEGAVIAPGFVNAHSHLEYAVYAGFGDGLPFGAWLRVHVERKGLLEPGDDLAIARFGAAECLRSGITTVADYSFTGAAAVAAAELGLRAIVYLEVFGSDPADAARQLEGKRERAAAPPERVTLGVSPHAPYSCSADVYAWCASLGVPVGTHLAESRNETEYLLHGTGPMAELRHLLVDPPGETGARLLARHGVLGPQLLAAHGVYLDREELELVGAARLRHRAARSVPPGHRARRARHRQPGLDAELRPLRGAAGGDLHQPRARGAARRPPAPRGARARDPGIGARPRPRRRDRLARGGEARRPPGRVARRLVVFAVGGPRRRPGARRQPRPSRRYSRGR
jgi:hypothetical protein